MFDKLFRNFLISQCKDPSSPFFPCEHCFAEQAQAQSQDQNGNLQAEPQLLPAPCGDICQVQSPWPGCGKPANEEQRLAATEKLQLIGKGPQPELQRYVDLVSVVYKVTFSVVYRRQICTSKLYLAM